MWYYIKTLEYPINLGYVSYLRDRYDIKTTTP